MMIKLVILQQNPFFTIAMPCHVMPYYIKPPGIVYSLVQTERHDRKKMTRLERVLILVIEPQDWVSIYGSQYGYLAFCFKIFRNNPILRPFSIRVIFFPVVSLLEPESSQFFYQLRSGMIMQNCRSKMLLMDFQSL